MKFRFAIVLIISLFIAFPVKAVNTAVFAFNASSISVENGSTFSVGVILDPGLESIDTARLNIDFNENLLEVVSFSLGAMLPNSSPGNSINNTSGSISQGGYLIDDSTSNPGIFGTIVFQAQQNGTSNISINSSSRIISSGVENINTSGLGSLSVEVYTPVEPEEEEIIEEEVLVDEEEIIEPIIPEEPPVIEVQIIEPDEEIESEQTYDRILSSIIPTTFSDIPESIYGLASIIIDNPIVEKVSEVSVPIVVVATTIATASLFTLANLAILFQSLFVQPLLYIFRRKRKGWGIVYDSLTKNPVDLAIVRLRDKNTNNLLQTRVTDKKGRYLFLISKPGQYVLEVFKQEFLYPSEIAREKREDVQYTDVYHGEPIIVTKSNTAISPNVPLDSKKQREPAKKLILKLWLRKLQYRLAFIIFIVSLVNLIVIPSLFILSLVIVNFVLYLLLRRMVYKKKPKNWGIVYDDATKKPISNAVASIYDSQYNKLLEVQLTDTAGRYSFLVGKNKFYVTTEKPGYTKGTSREIEINQEHSIVAENVIMNKENKVSYDKAQ